MKSKVLFFCVLFVTIFIVTSCETEVSKKERAARNERIKKEQLLYQKYGNNSLNTGATPYSYCFGINESCNGYGCSKIKVKSPYSSDVLVIIKSEGKVCRHAYIRANSSYTFDVPNGVYQTFFYYGKGWYPEKIMKKMSCGTLKGGFLKNEYFSKDKPRRLDNNMLTYELILQQNGNFQTLPSSLKEAF